MDVTYSGMTTGDIVTAFWLGYVTSPGTPVPGTQWTQTRTSTAQEAQLSLAVFHFPASAITPVGKGYGEGKYQVMFNNQGGTASSVAADVKLDLSSVAELSMSCSTGRPNILFNGYGSPPQYCRDVWPSGVRMLSHPLVTVF